MQDRIKEAFELHRSGKLAEAAARYREILKASPDNADALHLLGVIAAQTRDFVQAADLIGRAAALRPDDAGIRSNLANALRGLGRTEDAVANYDRAVALDPKHVDAWYNRGVALQALGRAADAVASYDRALALKADSPEAHTNRGVALRDLGRTEEALAAYDRALALRPDHATAHSNRGNALRDLGRPAEAIESYDRAIALRADYADAHYNRGIALQALGRCEEAVAALDRAIALVPGHADAWCARGNALQELGRLDDAISSYDRAVSLRPDYPEAYTSRGNALGLKRRFDAALADHERALASRPDYLAALSNRGLALAALHRTAEAVACYDRALALDPGFVDAEWNKALALLSAGEFAAGWEAFAARWRKPSFPSKPLASARPVWNGRDRDVRLLVWKEQGIGDQILFGTMLREAAASVSGTIALIDPRLVPLYERSISGVSFVGANRQVAEDRYDVQIPFGGLGRHFRRSRTDFPASEGGYLTPDRARAQTLRASLCRAGERLVGISWMSKNARFSAQKSLALEDFLPLLRLPGVRFVNLQYGDTKAETADLRDRLGIDVQACASVDNFNDLDGLAALIEACDLVVTTSNSTVHLAGAVGKQTLMLLTYAGEALWYWGNRRDGRSLWYPSVRMIAQTSLDDLPETVAAIADEARVRLGPG